MRAGPLANERVIALLNAHFVPVYAVNEDYRDGGPQPADERAEYRRIFKESLAAKLSTGTVHVYLLAPDGHPFDSLHVAQASKADNLIPALERAIAKYNAPADKPLVEPKPQSAPPQHGRGDAVLHLVARALRGGGSWGGMAENWIVLDREEQKRILPASAPAVGASWEIDKEIAAKILTHFYPPTENNDVRKNRFEELSLKASVIAADGGQCRARLDGRMKMRHDFYHKEDGKVVEATVVGYLDFDATQLTVRGLKLVTDEATYGCGSFGVAVDSAD
ncbi:MAG: hypothetical protein HY248_06260 [Fimbriimonas ginsengisoli]|nr:hypothetical protein [Fimbriimonas ginsengisoli]